VGVHLGVNSRGYSVWVPREGSSLVLPHGCSAVGGGGSVVGPKWGSPCVSPVVGPLL
jgi:hypothetical protein